MNNSMKVSFHNSIRFKIQIVSIVGVLLTVLLCLSATIPSIRRNFKQLSKSYLLDEAKAYGRLLETLIDQQEDELLNQPEELGKILGSVKIEGADSSYAYLVAKDGTMLYHPTASKIGMSVENTVVKQLAADMANGIQKEPECVDYIFENTVKYASYYVDDASRFVLVITADEAEVFQPIKSISMGMMVTGTVVTAVFLIVSLLVTDKIVKPLHSLTKIVNKVALLDLSENKEQKQLNQRKDEVGSMSQAISHLHSELTDVIEVMTTQSDMLHKCSDEFHDKFRQIAGSVADVNVAVEEIAQGSTSQAQETTAANEKIVGLAETIDQNSRNVSVLQQSVDKMNEYAENAEGSLGELLQITEKTMQNIQSVSKLADETDESARQIKEAVQLIQNITEQTNLLSLNASIEAARAGETGKGFAVVAGEIRRLAESSSQSADVITKVVQSLTANAEESVVKMSELLEDAKVQSERLHATSDTYDGLRREITNVSMASDQMSDQIEQLNSVKKSVSEMVEQLAAIAQENAAATEETSASIQALGGTIEECKKETDHLFQFSDELKNQTHRFVL